jgi:predicted transcriptional regulator
VGLVKAAPFVSFPQVAALAATFFDERRRLLEQVSDDQFQDAHNILQRVEAQRLCHFLDKRSE